MFARSDLAIIDARGPDVERFLQGQLTCDVTALQPGGGTWGGCCTPKGRLVAVFQLVRLAEDHFLLVLPRPTLSVCLAHLAKYSVFFKATLAPAEDRQIVCAEAGSALPEQSLALPDRAPGWLHAVVPAGTEPDDSARSEQVLAAELRAGIPVILPPTSGEFIPQAVGLDQIGGVSFKKGCYTGQEVVARAHYKGKVKKHLALLTADQPSSPGARITDDQGNGRGTVLACAADADGCWIQAVLDGSPTQEALFAEGHALEMAE